VSTSPKLEELLAKKCGTEKALSRCKRAISTVDSYMKTLTTQHVVAADLETVTRNIDAVAQTLDQKLLSLEGELQNLDEALDVERGTLKKPHVDDALRLSALIGVFANESGEVEMCLVYGTRIAPVVLVAVADGRGLAVRNASWHAAYDIQVKMDGSDRPVTLIYKASIVQDTGEVSSGCVFRSLGARASDELYSARTGKMLGSCWKRQRPPLG
jgi:hypothetical protein